MDKSRIRTHFQYSWWVYIVIIVLTSVLWCTVFGRLAQPKADEMLNITIVGDVDDSSLAEDLARALEGKTSKPLKEVNIEVVSGSNGMLGDIIAMRCLGETDLMIFEEDYLLRPMSSNFGVIDTEQLKQYITDAEFYNEDGEVLGMLLYDGMTDCNFVRYYSGDKKFWVFITPVSENAAMVNGKGTEDADAALQAITYLMEN